MRSRGRLITCLQIVILLSAAGAITWVALMDPGEPVIEHVALIWKDGSRIMTEDGHFSPSFDTSAFGETVSLIVEVTVRRTDPKRDFEYLAVVPERELIEQALFYQTGPPYPLEVSLGERIVISCSMKIAKENIEMTRARFKSHGIGHLIVAKFIPEVTILRVEKGYWNPLMNFLGIRRIWIRMQ